MKRSSTKIDGIKHRDPLIWVWLNLKKGISWFKLMYMSKAKEKHVNWRVFLERPAGGQFNVQNFVKRIAQPDWLFCLFHLLVLLKRNLIKGFADLKNHLWKEKLNQMTRLRMIGLSTYFLFNWWIKRDQIGLDMKKIDKFLEFLILKQKFIIILKRQHLKFTINNQLNRFIKKLETWKKVEIMLF